MTMDLEGGDPGGKPTNVPQKMALDLESKGLGRKSMNVPRKTTVDLEGEHPGGRPKTVSQKMTMEQYSKDLGRKSMNIHRKIGTDLVGEDPGQKITNVPQKVSLNLDSKCFGRKSVNIPQKMTMDLKGKDLRRKSTNIPQKMILDFESVDSGEKSVYIPRKMTMDLTSLDSEEKSINVPHKMFLDLKSKDPIRKCTDVPTKFNFSLEVPSVEEASHLPRSTPDLRIDFSELSLDGNETSAKAEGGVGTPMVIDSHHLVSHRQCHGRSQSLRPAKSPNLLSIPQQRPRGASLPGDAEEEIYRLRNFSTKGKRIVNRGDSLRSRQSRSSTSLTSDGTIWASGDQHDYSSQPGSAQSSAEPSPITSRKSSSSSVHTLPFRVAMLGALGVGKTALTSQFMTSEYINPYESIDAVDAVDAGEQAVSVMLDREESELVFRDLPHGEMAIENCISTYNPDAFVVVFSVVDKKSVEEAKEILQYLVKNDTVCSKAVILVGNKSDLVRKRIIRTEEGKALAAAYNCKFIETSAGIKHNVDELLVGILAQIRLKLDNPEYSRTLFRKRSSRQKKYSGSKTSATLKVKGLLQKVWGKDTKSKSCENLHIL